MTLRRLFYIAVLRCVLRLASRRCSRERNPIGCDGVEDNKPSSQNRECAFTEISTRGDFYAFFRRHRSDAWQKKLATMSPIGTPIGTESAKNFSAHTEEFLNPACGGREKLVCAADFIGRFFRSPSFADSTLQRVEFLLFFCLILFDKFSVLRHLELC